MILGLDSFATAEFAHATWDDLKTWIEVCGDSDDADWQELPAIDDEITRC